MPKIRVLIVDDHPMIRAGMRGLLEAVADFEIVGEAGNGEEAVSLSTELKPDVIIMDIVMPRLNGIEATRKIKQVSPTTAILILTAYSDIYYILGLLEAGACGYLLKDTRGEELVEAIRSVRAGESVLDPAVTRKLLERVVQQPGNTTNAPLTAQLTRREIEVLHLASKGLSNKDIADQLFLSLRTVKAHLTNIFDKMGCGSRTDAIIKGLKLGYITLDEHP
ncbi:MAG: response regulator transcription factor [Dehalococcoidales bacterium]|nr:response regulator transcription factor [Dehalococcoidales bacterium]